MKQRGVGVPRGEVGLVATDQVMSTLGGLFLSEVEWRVLSRGITRSDLYFQNLPSGCCSENSMRVGREPR